MIGNMEELNFTQDVNRVINILKAGANYSGMSEEETRFIIGLCLEGLSSRGGVIMKEQHLTEALVSIANRLVHHREGA